MLPYVRGQGAIDLEYESDGNFFTIIVHVHCIYMYMHMYECTKKK